ncbi:MAG: 4Fe-4S dicluster domain-containing protein, partial [Chloroflexi bacterium]|nr:4Fe-4S dicluster domain-containing protein [Chloroflexota bacterium]
MNRRALLRLFGGAVAGAAPLGIAQAAATASPVASAPGHRVRRWAMVIDLRRCDGCRSSGKSPQCTTACIEGHFAPEPMEWIEVYERPLEGGGTQFLPAPCMQCQNAPCVNVCPVGATFHAPEGTVLI